MVASSGRAWWGTTAAAGCAVIALLASACHRSSPADDGPPPTASAAAVRVAPIVPADHLAPGELLEGTDKAFDVILPRGLRVDGAFVDEVLTSGALAVHPLVEYFRTHVQNGDLREGATTATFDHVTAPGKPDRLLSVHIGKAGDGAHVEIRDTTPPKGPLLPDENARWKQVGLTPSGRLVDPTHLD
jgi:hypothetical protein